MQKPISFAVITTLIAILLPRSGALAQDDVFDSVGAGGGKFILIPKGVSFVRGGVSVDNFKSRPFWRKAVASWGFAIVSGGDPDGLSDIATFQSTLDELAQASGRPEVKNIPMCLFNASAGSGAYTKVAEKIPGRIISFCPSVLGLTGLSSSALKDVPMLANLGEIDGSQYTDSRSNYSRGDHQHAYVVNWRSGHMYAHSPDFFLTYWDRVIRKRLPSDADPRKGPVTLRSYRLEDGWLGNMLDVPVRDYSGSYPAPARIAPFSSYSGDKNKACWLPDAYLAYVWRSYNLWHNVSRTTPLTLTTPKRCSDGFGGCTEVRPGSSVRVMATYSGTDPIAKVAFYRGDSLLAERAKNAYNVYETTFPSIPRGIHMFLAVAYSAEGKVVAATYPASVYAFGTETSADARHLRDMRPHTLTRAGLLTLVPGAARSRPDNTACFDLRGHRIARQSSRAGALSAGIVLIRAAGTPGTD